MDSSVELSMGMEADVWVLLHFLAEGALTISCTLCFYPVLHQSVIFQTKVLKVFHSFQVPFSSFLPVSPSPASSSLPVGGDFPVPPTPSASLSFFFWQSVLCLWFHLTPNPFIVLPYFILPFVLSSRTPYFLKSSLVFSHLHILPPCLSIPPCRCPAP